MICCHLQFDLDLSSRQRNSPKPMNNDPEALKHKQEQAITMKSKQSNSRSKRSSLTSALVILTAIFHDLTSIPSTNASTSPRRSTIPFTSEKDLALKHRTKSNHQQFNEQNYNRRHSQSILQSNKRHKGAKRDVLFDDGLASVSTSTPKPNVRNSYKKTRLTQDDFEHSNHSATTTTATTAATNRHEGGSTYSNHYKTNSNTMTRNSNSRNSNAASLYHYDHTKPHQPSHQRPSNPHYNSLDGITSTQSSPSTSTSLLQVPLSLTLQQQKSASSSQNTTPIKTFLDTGAQVTIITFETAKKSGIAHLIDTRYAGHACGVAGVSCRVLGRIPARTLSFCFRKEDGKVVILDKTPAITVLEGNILGGSGGGNHGGSGGLGGSGSGVDMLLGLDVLEEWKATLCLYDRTLKLRDGMISGITEELDGDSVIIPLSCSRKNDDDHGHTSLSSSSYALEDDYGVIQQSKQQQSIGNDYYSMDDDLNQDHTYSTSTSSLSHQSLTRSTTSKSDNEYDDEEEEYLDDNYYFVDSEEEFDECDLSGV